MDARDRQGGRQYGEMRARQDSYIDAINRDILSSDDYKYVHIASLSERLNIYKKKFMEFDEDHSGGIDFFEMKQMLEKLGQPRTHLEAKKLMKDLDRDGSGSINYREFVDMLLGNVLGAGILFSEEAEIETKAAPKKKRQAPKPPSQPLVKQVSFEDEVFTRSIIPLQPVQTPAEAPSEANDEGSNSETEPDPPTAASTQRISASHSPPPYTNSIESMAHAGRAPAKRKERRSIPVFTSEVLPETPAEPNPPPVSQPEPEPEPEAEPEEESPEEPPEPETEPETQSQPQTQPQPAPPQPPGNVAGQSAQPRPQMVHQHVPQQVQNPHAQLGPQTRPLLGSQMLHQPLPQTAVRPMASGSALPMNNNMYPGLTANTGQVGSQSYIQPCTVPGCTDCPKVYPNAMPGERDNRANQLGTPQHVPMVAYPAGFTIAQRCNCAACTGIATGVPVHGHVAYGQQHAPSTFHHGGGVGVAHPGHHGGVGVAHQGHPGGVGIAHQGHPGGVGVAHPGHAGGSIGVVHSGHPGGVGVVHPGHLGGVGVAHPGHPGQAQYYPGSMQNLNANMSAMRLTNHHH